MVVYENVELSKFPEIDEIDSVVLQRSFDHFFKKIGGDSKLHLSYKGYKKGGLRSQHEIHAKLVVNGKSFFSQVTEWKLLDAIQASLKKLESEISKVHSKE